MKAPSQVLTLVGMCGAGKSTVATYLRQRGYAGMHFGTVITQAIEQAGQALTPQNEAMMRKKLRQKHGMAVCAALSLGRIDALTQGMKPLYIDGLYSWDEYQYLDKHSRHTFVLVEVYADKKKRYERLSTRPVRPLTPQEALERDLHEITHIAKSPPIAYSDYKIENNGSQAALERNICRVLDDMHASKPR